MIDKKNIVKGIGATILIASIGLGGIALYNGDYERKIEKDDLGITELSGKKTEAEIDYALCYKLPDDSPKFIEPEKVDKGSYEALRVPYGYEIYQIEGESAGIFSIDIEESSILNTAPLGISVDGYVGVSRDIYKLLRLEEAFKSSIKEGNSKDKYIELQKVKNDNNTTTLRVPKGYDIYYVGDDNSKKDNLFAINYEKNGEVFSKIDDYDYKLITGSSECDIDKYVGITNELYEKISSVDSIRQEMEDFYHGLQGKKIN